MFTSFGLKIEQKKAITIYKSCIVQKTPFTSQCCKAISTIDFFVKIKGGEVCAIIFYFILDSVFYAYVNPYEITKTIDHLFEIEESNVKRIYKITDIEKKMIYLKIGNREVLTSRPNMYEKT